jgi:hypothetical protein
MSFSPEAIILLALYSLSSQNSFTGTIEIFWCSWRAN